MIATDISALARHFYENQGAQAIAEAAQRAASFEKAGDEEQSNTWRVCRPPMLLSP